MAPACFARLAAVLSGWRARIGHGDDLRIGRVGAAEFYGGRGPVAFVVADVGV
jgi:hypothetical protein